MVDNKNTVAGRVIVACAIVDNIRSCNRTLAGRWPLLILLIVGWQLGGFGQGVPAMAAPASQRDGEAQTSVGEQEASAATERKEQPTPPQQEAEKGQALSLPDDVSTWKKEDYFLRPPGERSTIVEGG